MRAAIAAAGLALLAGAAAGSVQAPPRVSGCPVFPATNPWNRRVDSLPVARRSETLIRSIGLDAAVHADFGSGLWDGGPIGIPFTVVPGKQKKVGVRFDYADESDRGPYPIPRDVPIEGARAPVRSGAGGAATSATGRLRRAYAADGDRHALIVDRDHCRLYELYALYSVAGGGWKAGSGAIWNLRSNRLRPAGWTSADAAGLPILPGLARYDEVARGSIEHALRFTAERTRRAYVYPARHYASDSDDPELPPMGLRVRLKGGFDTRSFPPQARVVLEALKTYGMILADNGSSWFVSGAPDARWSNDQLHTLGRVNGSDFEVVDASSLRP